MDFFEVLLVLIFIVIPLLEGVFKQRRKKGQEGAPLPRGREPLGDADADARRGSAEAAAEGGGAARDESAAADMIPADLWEVLTGEKRQTPPTPAPWEEEEGAVLETWEDPQPVELEEEAVSGWDEWRTAPAPADRPPAKSLEYVGPEAISMEGPPPPPEVRHRRFHEKYDEPLRAPGPEPAPRARGLWAGLEGSGLRRSVLLAEILGPPQGLS